MNGAWLMVSALVIIGSVVWVARTVGLTQPGADGNITTRQYFLMVTAGLFIYTDGVLAAYLLGH
jgi:hypothetical protein